MKLIGRGDDERWLLYDLERIRVSARI